MSEQKQQSEFFSAAEDCIYQLPKIVDPTKGECVIVLAGDKEGSLNCLIGHPHSLLIALASAIKKSPDLKQIIESAMALATLAKK